MRCRVEIRSDDYEIVELSGGRLIVVDESWEDGPSALVYFEPYQLEGEVLDAARLDVDPERDVVLTFDADLEWSISQQPADADVEILDVPDELLD